MPQILDRPEAQVLLGLLLAALLIVVARALGPRRERLVYAVALIVTGVAYLVFGLRRGAPAEHLGMEAVGAVVFAAAAVLGARRWPLLLGLGWTAHVAWDLLLHHWNGPAYAPVWYPILCVGFDLFLGGYLLGAASSRTASRPADLAR